MIDSGIAVTSFRIGRDFVRCLKISVNTIPQMKIRKLLSYFEQTFIFTLLGFVFNPLYFLIYTYFSSFLNYHLLF